MIINSLVVAMVSTWLIPGFTLAMGFLLGGIVSPPDAVSAATVMKTVKVPRRLSAIIEGESLLNDASSLIVFQFAWIAVDTGQFVFHDAAWKFVVVIVMGILMGIAIAMLYFAAHKWLPTNPSIDIVLTLTAPYAMYLVAERFHFSGVLAVVSGGLFLSMRQHLFLSHRSRLEGSTVWATVSFVMNGLVFMLIGLEMPVIVADLGNESIGSALFYGIVIALVLIITRLVCTFSASGFTRFISRYIATADPNPGWKAPLLFGWAGMRGVVSLAAALSVPVYLNGHIFPQRNLILFITFTVILITLVVQGLTLPALIRWVKMEDTDHPQSPEEQHFHIRRQLAAEGIRFLETQQHASARANRFVAQLRTKMEGDHTHTPDIISEEEEYHFIYLQMLNKQRKLLQQLKKDPAVDEELIRHYEGLLDLDQEKLRVRTDIA